MKKLNIIFNQIVQKLGNKSIENIVNRSHSYLLLNSSHLPLLFTNSSPALLIYSISVNHKPLRRGIPYAWDVGWVNLYTYTSGRRLCYEPR